MIADEPEARERVRRPDQVAREVRRENRFRIEARALIMHADFDSVRRALQSNLYDLIFILTIAMQHGVGHGLAHSHIDSKRSVITDT